jgi:hypothetical protein
MAKGTPAMHALIAQAVGHAGSVPAHPEEIRATLKLRVGKCGRLNVTLRTTPAGLVTAGIMTPAIFLSIAALMRAACRSIRHYNRLSEFLSLSFCRVMGSNFAGNGPAVLRE